MDWEKYQQTENYERTVACLVPLKTVTIRTVKVVIGQLRVGNERSPFMVLFMERTDYPPGTQFMCLRLSTARKIWKVVIKSRWEKARKLSPFEKIKLDLNFKKKNRMED